MPSEELSDRSMRADDFVDRWHSAPEGELDGPLHEEMGWTWEEYARWTETGEMPPEREGAI